MKKISTRSVLMLLATTLLCAAASAQEGPTHGDSCEGSVYKQNEVSRKAAIKRKPAPDFTAESRKGDATGIVRLTAVLCRTGRVTDIRVVKGLPDGLTESAVAAARGIEFTPAEKDGRPVSVSATFEYLINAYGEEACKPGECEARLVEELVVEGNRRLTDEEITRHVKTRPGDAYDEGQARRDLQALHDVAAFDKNETRVLVEEGPRGGVRVIFRVTEWPIIRDLSFEGLPDVTEFDVLEALREKNAGVCKECPYDPTKAIEAASTIRKLLVARGWPDALVGVRVDEVSQVSVALGFVVYPEGR